MNEALLTAKWRNWMAESEDIDLEGVIKIAAGLSPQQREQFAQLLPPEMRAQVLNRLELLCQETEDLATEILPESDSMARTVVERPANPVETPTIPQTRVLDVHDETIAIGARQADADVNEDAGNSDFTEIPDDVTGNLEPTTRQSHVQILRPYARGAIGEVLVAYDDQLSREVALKRIRPELPVSERRVRRFIREAVITAKLQHPGIVPIYELDDDGKSAHYTMPLVSGSTLSEVIDKTHRELGPRPTRAQWMLKLRPLLTQFIAVCNAIDYAHSQKVLHRDLKPSNIIIGSQGQTLVLDWGCAKNIGDPESDDGPDSDDGDALPGGGADMTVAGSVLGTIEFMSPEQAAGLNEYVGPASDVFGLGATLFCVLTGDLAFRYDSDVKQALEQVRKGEFRRVDEINPRVPAPLVAICHRAMQKWPEDRYASAGDLGRDIDSFLAGEQVTAYREPLMARLRRFVWDHQTAVTTLVGTFLVGFVSLVFVTFMIDQQRGTLSVKNQQLASLNDQLERSVAAEKKLTLAGVLREDLIKRQLYETQMLLASEASSEPGGVGRMRELVDHWRGAAFESLRGWEWHHLDALGRRELWKLDLNATANRMQFTRNHPNAKVFDAGQATITTIDVEGRRILDVQQLPKNVTVVDFNHDQSLLAMGLNNGNVIVVDTTDANAEPVEFKYLDSSVTDVKWNVGGDYLATCDASGELVVWHWYERADKATAQGVLNQAGKRLLTWSYDGKQVFWTTGTQIRSLTMTSEAESVAENMVARDDWIANPCWSHEGKLLAYIGPENSIVVTDPNARTVHRFTGHQLFVESLAWHPTKHYLLSAGADGTVRIWDADTQKQVHQLLGHSGNVYAAAWSRNGQQIASGGLPEDSLRVWDMSNLGREAFDRELQDHPAIAWHPDGDRLAVAEQGDILLQNSVGDSAWIRSKEPNSPDIFGIDIDPSGKQIACVSASGRIWTVDIQSGEVSKIYDSGGRENQFPAITGKGIGWSPDGRFLAGVSGGGRLRVWDTSSGDDVSEAIESQGKSLVVAWSPKSDSKPSSLAYAGTDDMVYVFDPGKREITATITHYGWKTALAWSADATRIAVNDRRSISIYNVETNSRVARCDGPSAMVWDISWNGSQDRIAALTENGQVSIWNTDTWTYCAKFDLHDRAPYAIRWNPNGKQLVSTARYGRIIFQDAER